MNQLEIISELDRTTVRGTLGSQSFRTVSAIKVGGYQLSIQGSGTHYCTPRQVVPFNRYSSMEVAVYNKSGELMNINRSSVIRAFPKFKDLSRCSDGQVLGYVPTELINELYLYLKNR